MPNYLFQRLTFFADDDVTPLLGAVDVDGKVIDPTFSTDPEHVRPYLEFSEDTGQQDVDFLQGSSTIGTISLTILDKRRTANDQATGIFTWLQVSGTTGDTAVLRRRALWEGLLSDGITWVVLMNGVLTRVALNDDLVSYTIGLRDMRERERRVRLFVKNNNAVIDGSGNITISRGTCFFPLVGPMEGWGRPTKYDATLDRVVQYGAPQLEPTHGVKGKWIQDLLGGSYVYFDINDPTSGFVYAEGREDLFAKYEQSSYDGQGQILLSSGIFDTSYLTFDKYSYNNSIAQWSPNPTGGPWYTMKIMPANTGIIAFRDNIFEIVEGQSTLNFNLTGLNLSIPKGQPFKYVRSAKLIPSPGDTSPTNGQTVYVRYISNMQPEKDVPKYLEEETFGIFLKKIYDGEFSDPEVPPRVAYDLTAMNKMIADTPLMIGIVDEVVTDMRGWVEENIYKPLGYAPALSPDGTITPINYALPDETVPLLMLTDANVEKATWEHSDENVINKVTFTYQRDMVPAVPSLNALAGVKINTTDIIIENWNIASIPLFDTKSLDYKPVTTHSVLVTGSKFIPRPNVSSEVGWRLAIARTADVIMRFGNGAQVCTVTAMGSDPDVAAAKIGGWSVLGVSWLPDYKTRKRGIARLMQITSIKRTTPISYEFTLLDAGPYEAAKTCPTVNNIQQYADGRVSVDVTGIPADTIARLEFAISDTEPPPESGAWMLLKRTQTTGTVYTTAQAPGVKVWIRWRGEAQGARPSAWCGVLNITIANTAQMVDARLILIDGVPRVSWDATSSTLGIRVLYQRHPEGSAQPTSLGSSIDADVNLNGSDGRGYIDLPFKLNPYEQITVQVVGYPGFSGGAVSGTAGMASQYMTAQYTVDIGPPTVLPIVSYSGGGLVGAATLTVNENLSTDTIGVQVKDDANTIWTLVTSGSDATPLLVAPGTVIASTSWWHQGSTFEQLLMGQGLTAGVTRTFYSQVTATKTGLKSDWIPFYWQGAEATTAVVSDDTVVMDSVADATASTDFPNAVGLADSATTQIDRATADTIKVEVKDSSLGIVKLNATGTRSDGTFLRGDNTFAPPTIAGGSGVGAVLAYTEVTGVSPSLADEASATIVLTMAKTVAIQRVTTSAAASVRLYSTLAALSADIGRGNVDPAFGGAGESLFDVSPGVSSTSLIQEPRRNVVCNNGDNPRSGKFYMRVTNNSDGTATITTVIRHLPLEGVGATIPPDVLTGMLWEFDVQSLTPVADGTETLIVPNSGLLGGNIGNGSGFGSGPKYRTNQINGRPAIKITQIGGNTRSYGLPTAGFVEPTESHVFAIMKTIGGGAAWMVGPDRTSFPNAPGNVSDWHQTSVERLVSISNNPSTGAFLYHSHSSVALFEADVGLTQRFIDTTNTVSGTSQRTLLGHLAGGFLASVFEGLLGHWRFYSGSLTDDEVLGIKTAMSDYWGGGFL